MGIDLERILNERKSGQKSGDNSKTLIFRLGNERRHTKADGTVSAPSPAAENQPFKPQRGASLASEKVFDAVSKNIESAFPAPKNISPDVKDAVDKAFERIGYVIKKPTSYLSPYKTGSLDNQIKYAEQQQRAIKGIYNEKTPSYETGTLMGKAEENLENLKTMRYNINNKNKRTQLEKVTGNEDFEKYSADKDGRKSLYLLRFTDNSGNILNQAMQYATENERKIFFYYLGKEGQKKAGEYYKTIERELNARRAVQKSKEDEKFGNEHKILASAKTIAESLPAARGQISEIVRNIKNKYGEFEPADINSGSFDHVRAQEDLERGITKDMSGAGRFFTQTGLSMGKSLASSIFDKFGLIFMSGNAAAQSTYEALKNGATSSQALTKGFADGFTEFITEKIPFDNFLKVLKGGDVKGAKAIVKNLLKQAGAEGIGESLAEYMNYAIDGYVMGDKSDFNSLVNTYTENGYSKEDAQKEAYKQYLIVNPALAFAGGAISGVAMGGIAQTTNYLARKWQNHIEGKTDGNKKTPSKQTENVQDTIPGSSFAANGLKYSIDAGFEQNYNNWVKNGRDNDSRLLVGKTSGALKSIGVKAQNIIWDTSKINASLKKHAYLNDDILKQVPYLLENPIIVMQSKNFESRLTMFGEVYDGDGLPIMAVLELTPTNIKGNLTLDEIKIASTHSRKNSNNPSSMTQTQNLINTSDILYIEPNKERTDNWLVANRLQLPLHITNYGSIKSVSYPSGNVNEKTTEAPLPVMTAPQLSVDTVNKSAPINDSVSQNGGIVNDIDIDGEGIGRGKAEAEILAGARLEKILKIRYGIETVHFNDQNGAKGYYDPRTKKMYINDFYTSNRYAATAHEFFHSYKDIDGEGYGVIKKAVLADLSLDEFNRYKERLINLRKNNNLDTENIDIDDLVAEEIISDLGAEVLKNPESLEGILKRFENDRTFIEKFMDYIRRLARKVREFLDSDYIENDGDIRNLVKNYSEIENIYKSVLESGGVMDYSAEGNDTGVKFSIVQDVTDDNGNKYKNAVLLDTDIFDGISPRNWAKKLKSFVENRAKTKPFILPVTDENGNKQMLEFAKPNDRIKTKSGNTKRVLDKLHTSNDNISKLSVVHIDEIVSISDEGNPYFTKGEQRHQWLDKNGWLHRNAKVINSRNGALYEVGLDIAKTDDGRLLLYTTGGKIKKLGNVQVNSFNNKRLGTEYQAYGDSVSQSGEDVKYKLPTAEEKRDEAMRKAAQMRMNEMKKEARQATDEGLDIEKYYNTPPEKRITEKNERLPRLERMEKAAEKFRATGDSFTLPKKSDFNSYKRDAERKGIYYNNIETYMKNQLSAARSEDEKKVIKNALDMFLKEKFAYENDEKARAQKVITSMDEAYKMLDTKRNFKITKEVAEDITDNGKTVFSYKSTDFFRNMRNAFGKHYGVVKDIIDDFNDSKGDMARSINERLADLYKTVVKDLGISKGSRESAAVMWYGEGEKTPDLTNADDILLLKKMGIKDFKNLDPNIKVKYDGARLEKDFGHVTAEKIKKADKYFRKVYDEYIDALNAEIKIIYPFGPEKQINKRNNYYRHFNELTNTYSSLFEILGQNANIDPNLAGISPYTKPKSKWLSIEQKRKGKATAEDAVGGFLNYIPMAEYRLNIDKHISVIRTLASDLAELKGGNGNANNLIKYLNDYANDLAGKTVSNLDRFLIDCFGRRTIKGLSWV